jgi:transmembrane sensor
MDKYALYQTGDFLRDESFVNWVLYPDENDQTWAVWLQLHPEKREAVEEAVSIIRSFDFQQQPVAANYYSQLKQRIDQTIASQSIEQAPAARIIPVWLKAAALVAGLLIGGFILYYIIKPGYVTISTPYAAIQRVWLPDSSEVVLNAHSTIRYRRGWNHAQREVWITGEAFFKVRHIELTSAAQTFTVHAGKADITVLGTEFDVRVSNNTTGVFLQQGKVQLRIPASHEQTIMQPNDYCQYHPAQGKIVTREANPLLYTAWMEHRYRFESTPAREVCATLKAYFGYDFDIRKQALAQQPISGTLELQHEAVMWKILSELLNAKVSKKGNTIVIE